MSTDHARTGLRWWLAATVGIVAAAIALRLFLNFSYAYPPATDAGYYPMQTRAWLEHGRLMYNDLPLVFWLNAAITGVLHAAGMRFDDALLMASRVVDCVLPPWAAAAVMAGGYAWSGGRRRALVGCIAASALVLFSPPVMRMLSDFQKNSLGIVWMAFALVACRAAMLQPSVSRWIALAAIMGLAALTHVGAFSVTAVMIGIALAIWIVPRLLQPGLLRRVVRGLAGSALATSVVITLLVYFEPGRAIAIVRTPLNLFGPAWLSEPVQPALILAAIIIGFAIRRLWKDRRDLPWADVAVVSALA